MDINRRNYNDFNQAIQKLQQIVGKSSFANMTIEDLEYFFDYTQDVMDEWKHLDSDIDEWLNILENIEEK